MQVIYSQLYSYGVNIDMKGYPWGLETPQIIYGIRLKVYAKDFNSFTPRWMI